MLEFIVANLPVLLCILAGMALVTLEVFLPGFGVPGISGVVLLLIGLGLTWGSYGIVAALGLLIIVVAVLAVVISISLKSAAKGALSKSPLVLHDTLSKEDGYEANDDMQVLLGHSGKSITVLRPTGMADFDGVRLNVVTEGEFIEQDVDVTIISVEGSRIVVRRVA